MIINKLKILFILNVLGVAALNAQDAAPGYVVTKPDGTIMMAAYITATGDTMLYCQLREIEISAPKSFASADDYKRYEKYQRYAPTVLAYAVDAVKTYRQLEAATGNGDIAIAFDPQTLHLDATAATAASHTHRQT